MRTVAVAAILVLARAGAAQERGTAAWATVANPVPPTEQSISDGRQLYQRYCRACHHASGNGKGPYAIARALQAADFTDDRWDHGSTDGEIGLGLKQLLGDPWTTIATKYAVGQVRTVRITRVAEFGVLVELEPGIEGLAHESTLAPTGRPRGWAKSVTADLPLQPPRPGIVASPTTLDQQFTNYSTTATLVNQWRNNDRCTPQARSGSGRPVSARPRRPPRGLGVGASHRQVRAR